MSVSYCSPGSGVSAPDPEVLWFNGALMTVRVPGTWSDGRFCLVEVESTRGRATGLHTDPSDETFHLLDGELLFHVEGSEREAAAGDTVAVARGVRHAFIVTSPMARFLVLNTPGTHDSFFRDGGEPATHRDHARAPAPDLDRTMASASAHGVELLGPPPFTPAAVAQTTG